ncbi:hypothetical protein [Sphingorhabdus sp.]|uniref:hypothetical protein n=1 Tax=Sphingorhabdus sp. TaxID=1902408 RepID=UPI00398343EF
MTIKRIFACAALALSVAACTPNDIGLGNAVRANYAAQVVEPDPQYADAMVANGAQAAAQDRYRKGNVKKPVRAETTVSKSGSGSGGQPN